ncbi:DNA adenine methylase [Campylobacter geochelonis]|uniref:site-specific DNA-methyltransferase (adenine-specific) n=1 Tax=Campylobacter geochelonis TaxID=1780362 RepID=A0A128EIE0_9BACT|nr:DNA adenine methylase [Campylobacter geochelonis]QKF71582.1 type IIP restriction/modification system, adenine-specific DNA methyltransferase [Campylobacter geochelonis]CZE48620.1 D12-class N6-adenine-specific DNA methyltransferase [Campylobacter geochelonis]CZE49353.1 D12-class N6-adenine-specific DNA methyltransferase [Campylobacter geochelonis]CZE51528.1 D12-class N6-adenine-specific DNA methyltransferase [Campylobacter geochelonis]
MENKEFLTQQIITYLGNKRSLLEFINTGIEFAKDELKKDKISFCDLFSGSGIVSRYAKSKSNFIIANDLELYSKVINECYLTNANDEILKQIDEIYPIISDISKLKNGFISELYAPKDDTKISKNDRVFYTNQNAKIIDTIRQNIDEFAPDELKAYFLAPLLYEASVHANTSGVFKGFYKNKKGVGEFGGSGKNALGRILGEISLKKPVFSKFSCEFSVEKTDANLLASSINTDVCYIDPPYNQHPYGSNYFMLNLISTYQKPQDVSKVSGITKEWNRSVFNQRANAKNALLDIVEKLRSKVILISYNCEGFVKKDEFLDDLAKFGKVNVLEQKYNAFRASRNLNSRSTHVNEQLYILKKR